MDFDIAVVANRHRKPLIVDYLKNIPHEIIYTPDFDLPNDWKCKPEYKNLTRFYHQQVGHYRCLMGHKLALQTSDRNMLILEDDAVPNRRDWFKLIEPAAKLLDRFELVSVHGREVKFGPFKEEPFNVKRNMSLWVPKNNTEPRWVLGSLAYFISRKAVQRFLDYEFVGMGCDLFIANCFHFALVNPSVFNHDRSQGSLIDLPGRTV